MLVALPTLASIMVILKWLYLHRVLEGKGFRRAIRDHPVEVQLPSDGVLVHPIARGVSLPTLLE
jgi:hypothetical protein